MNNKMLYGAALSVLMLTACSQDNVIDTPKSDAISFAVTNGATSRASQSHCNTNLPGSFNVSAQFAGTNDFYFANDVATRAGETGTTYTSSPERFWPEEKLDFHAWANDDGKYAHDGVNAQFVNFAPKATVAEQLDLLYAVAMNQGRDNGNVKLNFRHALSQIVFSARSEAKTYNVAISGVTVGHLNNQGTFTFAKESTKDNYENHTDIANGKEELIKGGQGSWELNGDLQRYATSFDAQTLTNETVKLTDVNHQGGADGSLILLPQNQTAWTPAVDNGVAKDNEGFNGAYFLLDVNFTYGESTSIYNGQIAVPVEISWEQGHRYRYTFVFTEGNGGFTPDPENPQPVLGGIKYEVSVDDFVPVDGGEIKPGDDPRGEQAPKYSYSLSYNANGGEGTMDAMTETEVAYGKCEFTVMNNAFTRANYTFTGWNTKADGTGTAYKAGDVLALTGVNGETVSTVLYAQWAQNEVTLKLSFDSNGGDNNAPQALTATVKAGESATFTIPTQICSKNDGNGWVFLGWSEEPITRDGVRGDVKYMKPGNNYNKASEITISEDTTLYAVWGKAGTDFEVEQPGGSPVDPK